MEKIGEFSLDYLFDKYGKDDNNNVDQILREYMGKGWYDIKIHAKKDNNDTNIVVLEGRRIKTQKI